MLRLAFRKIEHNYCKQILLGQIITCIDLEDDFKVESFCKALAAMSRRFKYY